MVVVILNVSFFFHMVSLRTEKLTSDPLFATDLATDLVTDVCGVGMCKACVEQKQAVYLQGGNGSSGGFAMNNNDSSGHDGTGMSNSNDRGNNGCNMFNTTDAVSVQCFKRIITPDNTQNLQRFWVGLQHHIQSETPVRNFLISVNIATAAPLQYDAFVTAMCTASMSEGMSINNFNGNGANVFEAWGQQMNTVLQGTMTHLASHLVPMGVQF